MDEPKEISIRVKDDEKTLKHKFLIYDKVLISSDDPVIKDCVDQTMEDYKGEAPEVTVTIKFNFMR